jgi:type II secretory ATPase GspE/PulE/Tfp pilus assembly ATPase PilB-like protein
MTEFTKQPNRPWADFAKELDFNAVGLVSLQLASSRNFVPFALAQDELSIAFSEAHDPMLVENLQMLTGKRIKVFQGEREKIKNLLKAHQPMFRGGGTGDGAQSRASHLLEYLLQAAGTRRASDLHLEPLLDGSLQVRLRIDGYLHHLNIIDAELGKPLLGRIKILAAMDVAEHRLPQDGRFTSAIGGTNYDVRVALIPVIHGEKIVLRILSQAMQVPDLASLGLNSKSLLHIRQFLRHTTGMLIVAGPTGSGKTTTLYGCIKELLPQCKNITTVEDPVEYAVSGINQMAVNTKAGLTFAAALRAIVRQDPDVVMVGEIRDEETARLAVRAALTGHLVISSIHAETATGAVLRLLEMGVEPYLVHAALRLVINQRLVRLRCPHCGGNPEISCGYCGSLGFCGRTGIFEILQLDACALTAVTTPDDLLRILPQPLQRLEEDLREKTSNGLTSAAEAEGYLVADSSMRQI